VAVSVHDATLTSGQIEHHVYQCQDHDGIIGSLHHVFQCQDHDGIIGSLHHVLPNSGLVPLCGR
jgi:hypothetical protein